MKIVYCMIDCSLNGGTERTISIQASYFAKHGHEVHIITEEIPEYDKNMYYFSDKIQFHYLDIGYREVDNSISPLKIWRRIKKGQEHKQKLERLLCLLHPDFTISVFGHEVSFLYSIKDGSRKILQYHFSRSARSIEFQYNGASVSQKLFTAIKEWRKRRFINRYDAFVVLTKEDAKFWGNIWNLYVITNAISFVPEKSSTCLNKQVISLGRLPVQKGYDMLLDAWSRVVSMHPGWKLVIYGKGDDYVKLQVIIQQYKLGDSVHIFPPTRDIVNKYLESSVYVMSSRYEGFPMVLPEAMACGVPCVSFDAPCGPAEIISDGEDGFITPLGDVQRLAEKLSLLMSDDDLRIKMGKNARRNVMRYSVDRIMKQWVDLFEALKGDI